MTLVHYVKHGGAIQEIESRESFVPSRFCDLFYFYDVDVIELNGITYRSEEINKTPIYLPDAVEIPWQEIRQHAHGFHDRGIIQKAEKQKVNVLRDRRGWFRLCGPEYVAIPAGVALGGG